MIHKLVLASLLAFFVSGIHAQTISFAGRVLEEGSELALQDASVVLEGTGKVVATNAAGEFVFRRLKSGAYTLAISKAGYLPLETKIELGADVIEPRIFLLRRDDNIETKPTDIPTITLDEAEANADGASEVANLLHASRDVFQNISGFGWSVFRFRERGYDSGMFQIFMNGVPFNDPETGWTPFSDFSGLNDVLRNRETAIGLDPAGFSFSALGGATSIDTRAGSQRKQIRASYAISNRIYRNRVMLTASTGMMPGDWALTVSGSRRWAEEGYVPGTFFDAYSYFLSLDKRFGARHALNLTFFGAPTRRGRTADSFQEMFDVAGSNYYNPLWGYQNGEKRNSQVQTNHQPVAILRYDWAPSRNTQVLAAAYTQFGAQGFSRLNWQDAANPAPDYNRRLPSSLPDSALEADWYGLLRDNESLRQIDWAALYDANSRNPVTVQNADGIPGNTVSGQRALYIVEDQRSENLEAGLNLIANHTLNDRISLSGGAFYQYYRGRNFKVMDDLLGGDFWFDWDFFGQFDAAESSNRQSDLRFPNRLSREGDVFGYDYDENIRRASAWGQAQFNLARFQAFAAAELGQTTMWRTGNMQNGRFPTSSLGDSDRLRFLTGGIKAGLVWKANGRNYLYANGYYGNQAPQYRNAFLSPRVRNAVVPGVSRINMQSVEGGYLLRAPKYKARVTGYFTEFKDESALVFSNPGPIGKVYEGIPLNGLDFENDAIQDLPFFIGSVMLQGVDRRHTGVEIGIEARPVPSWVFSAATSIGQYIYTSRPNLYLSPDYNNAPIFDAGQVYQKEYFVPRTPQTTASVSVKYESRRFWFASLSLNWADNFWYEFDRVRRTTLYVEGTDPASPAWNMILDQQKAPSAYTLDLFAGKSWRIYRKYFIYLNVGVNNLLNNQDIIISGREVYRNAFRNDIADPRYYTNELLYGFGTNYFVSLSLRI